MNEGKIKTFSGKRQVEEIIVTAAPQEMLKVEEE